MKSPICDMFGIEFPLVAFSHCRDVVVAVSKAGGMGVLGAAATSPEQLEVELQWIDENIDGLPYGVDLLIPDNMVGKQEEISNADLLAMVPQTHKDFADKLLTDHDVDTSPLTEENRARHTAMSTNLRATGAQALLDVAFAHPIRFIVNALGVPPDFMLQQARDKDVRVGALVGAKEHAIKQVKAGVDVLVVSGTEGGGHCGKVSTIVLIPEVHRAIQPYGDTPILAAGGIVTGQQMAACMSMGAAGAWTASVWLTTAEAETSPAVKEKMLAASSSQTVRSKSRTGKFSRQLQSAWTDAWELPDSPDPLPMPLQSMVSEPALAQVQKLADGGHAGARQLATYWVGQGVGLMESSQSARTVVQAFKQEFLDACERLQDCLSE
jgi:NAD(P)H-dependent flavin oxidoreductase YrpB (nitropropane dioxygenase family)